MELSQLEIFQKVAVNKSMKKAADALFISQSAVSKSIAALEQDLGFKLFSRNNNKIELTAAGEAFLPHIQKALDEISVARVKGQEAALNTLKAINVGCAFPWFMYKGVNDFSMLHPDISINCTSGTETELRSSILSHAIFMAITFTDMTNSELVSVPIISEDSFVLSGQPIQNAGCNVSLQDLRDYPFAVSDGKDSWYQKEEEFFRMAGLAPKISFRGITGKNASRFLPSSNSLCILPAHDAHLMKRTQERMPADKFNLCYYRLTDEYTYLTIYFTFLKDCAFHPLEKEFYDTMEATLTDIESKINQFTDENYL